MALEYLKDSTWKKVTRDERLFCSYLYHHISDNTDAFINLINKNENTLKKLDTSSSWEIGFEVNIYRDLFGMKTKRTFDLCLFSEKTIVIIEAKAHQGFDSTQSKEFKKDKEKLNALISKYFKKDVEIKICALASSKYYSNIIKKYKSLILPFEFESDFILSWKDCYAIYNKEIFNQADNVYKQKPLIKTKEVY